MRSGSFLVNAHNGFLLLLPLLHFSTGGHANPSDPPAIHLYHCWSSSTVEFEHWAEVPSSCPPNLPQPPAQLLPGPQMGQFLVVTMSSGALWLETLMGGNGRVASSDDTRPGPIGQTQIQTQIDIKIHGDTNTLQTQNNQIQIKI